MKPLDLFKSFTAHKTATEAALSEHKLAIEARDNQISELTAKLEAFEATADTSGDSSEEDDLISELQQVLDKYKKDEDSGDSDSSDDSTDSGDDSSDDESAKASRVEKLKASIKTASKIVAEQKASKASVAKQVIREIAAVGIPTPVATQPEGKTVLKGLDRVSAAFAEQLTPKK